VDGPSSTAASEIAASGTAASGTAASGTHSAEEIRAEPGWRKLLTGTPREVLARLVQDDPLGVREKVASHLKAEALLLDSDRVHLRVIARVSRFAGRYRGRPELPAWIESAVAEAVDELLREDHESDGSAPAAGAASPDAFAALAPPLGFDPGALRKACAAFNRLPFADRSAFLELAVAGRSLDEVARAAAESATEVARRARRGLEVLLARAIGPPSQGGKP
jgi:DNA-directed RNA polymerase specialized sigma24 family protein